MKVTRRFFLRSGAVAAVGLGIVPRFLARAAEQLAGRGKTLVVVFQRGAADGLNIVVPHAEPSMAKVTDTSYARLLSFRRAQLMLPLTRSPACSSRKKRRISLSTRSGCSRIR